MKNYLEYNKKTKFENMEIAQGERQKIIEDNRIIEKTDGQTVLKINSDLTQKNKKETIQEAQFLIEKNYDFINDIKKAQNGDKDAMAKLVEENQGLVWNIARRFLGRGYDKEDIYQIGCMGFIKAIRRFNADFEVQLSTYAVPYILGEIKKFLRDDGPVKVSRSLKELNVKINELQKEYANKGKELSLVEISKILKVPKEDIVLAIESAQATESIENAKYSNSKSDNKELTLIDTLSTNKDEANLITNKITVRKMIEKLGDREKQIILLRFYKDKTQSEVAKILGISQVQVSRIEKKILEGMRRELVS